MHAFLGAFQRSAGPALTASILAIRALQWLLYVGVGAAAVALIYHAAVRDLRASPAYAALVGRVLMPLLRAVDPEDAHGAAVLAAAWGLTPIDDAEADSTLATSVWGINFENPIGLAAGFDKQVGGVDEETSCAAFAFFYCVWIVG